MKSLVIIAAVIAASALLGNDVCARQTATKNDSIATAVRLKSLRLERDRLQKEIKEQDSRRGRQMAGVAPGTAEELNDRQDSICLALRSELTDVMLEIKELTPAPSDPALLQQLNNFTGKKSDPEPAKKQKN